MKNLPHNSIDVKEHKRYRTNHATEYTQEYTEQINEENNKHVNEEINKKNKSSKSHISNKSKFMQLLDSLNKYLQEEIQLRNPLAIAENLHEGNYVNQANDNQLWIMKRFYNKTQYITGLVDIGNKFLSAKNYHGTFESFHAAKYITGLIAMTKEIVKEVNSGNRNNIGYAKKALVDIILLEGKNNVKEYISDIANAYLEEYKNMPKDNINRREYLIEARELYILNKDIFGIAKVSAKILAYKSPHKIHPEHGKAYSGIL